MTDEMGEVRQELLRSGILVDVKLICGDQQWDLHKMILCKRSKWFKKALCGKFLEAETNVITLHDEDPEAVDMVVNWIYTNSFPVLDDEHTLYVSFVMLAKLADFLWLDQLSAYATAKLKENLQRKKRWFQNAFFTSDDVTEQMDTIDIEGYFMGARAAFEHDLDWAKAAFVSPIKDLHYWTVSDKNFRDLCKHAPEFSHELFNGLAELALKNEHMPHFKPRRCARKGCESKPSEEPWLLSSEETARMQLADLRGLIYEQRQNNLSDLRYGPFNSRQFLFGKTMMRTDFLFVEKKAKVERLASFYWAKLDRRKGGSPIAYCNHCVEIMEFEDHQRSMQAMENEDDEEIEIAE